MARRRELLSELSVRKEKEETSRRAEMSRREKEEDSRRLREEMRRKEQERAKKEIESIRTDEARKYAQSLVDKGILKANDMDVCMLSMFLVPFSLTFLPQKMETYDTEGLIVIQVAQLEKEKKELNEKLRVVAKRVDHIERAYRKEERPLLARDYEQQKKNDRETYEALQRARKDVAHVAHQEDMGTKARLSRMMVDYQARREVIVAKKAADFAKKKEAAHKKIEEEKTKRRNAVMKAREEERLRVEAELKRKKELEEEARRKEEGKIIATFRILQVISNPSIERLAEEQRQLEAEAAVAAEAERKKREREAERAAALEQARLQQQREEEAEARRQARREAEKTAATRKPLVVPSAVRANGGDPGWRRDTPANSTPPTPTRHTNVVESSKRPESPSPAAAPKYRPGALGGGGWRAREEAKAKEETKAKDPAIAVPARVAAPSPRPSSPALPAKDEPKADNDGFQTVESKRGSGVWRPRRGRA